ncbi:squalene/phytoene synthase family protein [Sphingomonas sp. SM33]|uniref:Squalene/phytoene synthase family protein n=1 Tax=Sphingomonas telluris TaxID=2907998 RepID=A0ABS9VKG0_9SPHN|nr:squalene/phytoene synthase family protein [Sphingomonas telluris]MCH8615462.1 squalene/phytoene synthase family protein [Sphingomonas telluris]
MSSPPQRPSVTADEELAAAIGADRALMLRQVPAEVRPALEALFQIDAAMADVVARSTQPALAAVKLAWWRERLEDLDRGSVPAEPRLQAAAEILLPRGVSGADLAILEDGWATLLEEAVEPARVETRGAQLFSLAGRLLASQDEKIADAGSLYALVSVGRRGVPELLQQANGPRKRVAKHRFARALRPLTALARLAIRDLESGPPFEQEGSPPRLAAMLRHRWSGIVTRGD